MKHLSLCNSLDRVRRAGGCRPARRVRYPSSEVEGNTGVLGVGELFGGDRYTFAVTVTNGFGTGTASTPSSVVTMLPLSGGAPCTPPLCRPVP